MKRKSIIFKIAIFALALAPGIVGRSDSFLWIGEPKLPKRMLK